MNKKMVVIILGNRLNDDGSISKIQEERLLMAMEIEKEFNPSYFILSGGLANKKAGLTEAEAMYNYLVNKGFNKQKLVLEDKSLTTVENAKYSMEIVRRIGAEIVMVCSSSYHFADPDYKAFVSFMNELRGTGITLMTYSR